MKLTEYVVFVSWFDELATLVLDASSPEEAVAMAKDAMEKRVRDKGTECKWSEADTEERVARYRNGYEYRASTTAKILANSSKAPVERKRLLETLKSWREPRLPTGCPY
jgi:hypothetical protein